MAAQLHILTLLENVKEQQMQLAAAVNNLSARLGTQTPVAEMPHQFNIPLATMPEVEEFEEWLKDSRNAQAKQNMISALGGIGGQNTKKATWSILSSLFSAVVAKQINWKGVNGKKCFKEMQTRSVLIRAVRNNQCFSSATDTEIDCHTIRWFNLACDRGGGRKERARAKEALTEDLVASLSRPAVETFPPSASVRRRCLRIRHCWVGSTNFVPCMIGQQW
ncbi:hypothetical protein QQF64_026281 [Cirrhinus molitorella]|uniref:DUF4806 domain-containing protein n=1 Tax=Cirrhinus molitorella TaxID=172907 RepID=A0ABR3NSF7_9TELE